MNRLEGDTSHSDTGEDLENVRGKRLRESFPPYGTNLADNLLRSLDKQPFVKWALSSDEIPDDLSEND